MKHLDNIDIRSGWVADLITGYPHLPENYERIDAHLTKLIHWDDEVMARKTYRIELKIDFNDDANHEIMLGIAKQYARDLLGSAMLLQDGRKPAVALMTDDSFHGVDEIDLMDQSQTIHAE